MARFWRDESGVILSAELVLLVTILVIAMVVGLSAVAKAVSLELQDIAAVFQGIDQTTSFTGTTGCGASGGFGVAWIDAADQCDSDTDNVIILAGTKVEGVADIAL